MSLRKCVVCGEIFKPSRPKSKYCTDACRKIGNRENRRMWQAANPDYMKNYMRDRREKQQGASV